MRAPQTAPMLLSHWGMTDERQTWETHTTIRRIGTELQILAPVSP